MKPKFVAVCSVLLSLAYAPAQAQLVFTCQDLMHQIGEYYRAGVQSNLNVSALPGQPGGPQQWSFFEPVNPTEYISRVDIVPPSDSGQQSNFPLAAYAERETVEPAVSQRWDFYALSPTGRIYYGWYDPNTQAGATVVLNPPVVDFPASVQLGQSWTWSADYQLYVSIFLFDVHTTVRAQVDGYGTLVLPGIGEVPALRVAENRTNALSFLGSNIDSEIITSYSWLVRGLGKAAKINRYAYANNLVALPFTNTFLRVFEASHVTDRKIPVADLRIALQSGLVALSWTAGTNVSGYQVEMLSDLNTNSWQLLSEPSSNSWSEPFLALELQRFYRVFAKP